MQTMKPNLTHPSPNTESGGLAASPLDLPPPRAWFQKGPKVIQRTGPGG